PNHAHPQHHRRHPSCIIHRRFPLVPASVAILVPPDRPPSARTSTGFRAPAPHAQPPAPRYLPPMNKGRLEAFSDGVIAVAITIMVLDLKPPHEESLHALSLVYPTFLSYLLSFVYVAI